MDLVSVVISIYRPDIRFLVRQLETVECQDYENIEVIIRDDDPGSAFDESILETVFKRRPYRYVKGDSNLGYARSFEYLTQIAGGRFIAYCDQDDIWEKDKISRCIEALNREKAVLATSDRAIIDENGRIVVPSYRAGHHNVCDTWKTGDHIVPVAVFTTCAIGMSIVMDTKTAQSLLPLPEKTAHDKWLTAGAAVKGRLVFIEDPLVRYRRHSSNVSGMFRNMRSKADYYAARVAYSSYLAGEFVKRFPELSEQDRQTIMDFAEARKNKNVIRMLKYRKLAPDIVRFEILLKFIPDRLFLFLTGMIQKRNQLL